MGDYAWRFDRARALAREASLDGLYITAGANFRWLTGEDAHPGGWPLWLSAILVPVDGPPAIVFSEMHGNIFDVGNLSVSAQYSYTDGESPLAALRAAAASSGLTRARVGADAALWLGDVELLAAALPDMAVIHAKGVFDRLRAVKDTSEIENLQRAADIHDAGYAAARELLRPGITVAEAGYEIVRAMVRAGSGELAIVGSFTELTARAFAEGDVVDVDLWPGSYDGYHADSARNFFLGEPTDEARRLYDATSRAYDAAMAALRPGVTAESVHLAAVEVMTEAGFDQVWKIGHGVGLAPIHEPPLLQVGNGDPMEAGMVVTIDPGAFIAPATPIHIEDTVVVTEHGCESLNRFTREMQVL